MRKNSEKEMDELVKDMRDKTMDEFNKQHEKEMSQMMDATMHMRMMYICYRKAGFTKKEALDLVKHTIEVAMNGQVPEVIKDLQKVKKKRKTDSERKK